MGTRTRFITLSGCANFRDLGGYRTPGGVVMPGLLFRSDSLHRLERNDRLTLAELGLTSALDLRSVEEVEETIPVDLGPRVDVHHIPTIDTAMNAPLTRPSTKNLAHGYELLLTEAASQHADALRHVARADGPVVFFCNAGKDRTGLLAALLLGLLGVDDDDVVRDYELSAGAMDHIRARILDEQPERLARWKTAPEDVLGANGETMVATLGAIRRRWGGFAGYALDAGLDQDDIDSLRRRLIHAC